MRTMPQRIMDKLDSRGDRMSGIYIPNTDMPKNGEIILVYPDGNAALFARMDVNVLDFALKNRKAVSVPDHGDLIDRDAYKAEMKKRQDNCAEWRDNAKADGDMEIYHRADGALSVFCEAKLTLDKMPTIIPADGKDGAE